MFATTALAPLIVGATELLHIVLSLIPLLVPLALAALLYRHHRRLEATERRLHRVEAKLRSLEERTADGDD